MSARNISLRLTIYWRRFLRWLSRKIFLLSVGKGESFEVIFEKGLLDDIREEADRLDVSVSYVIQSSIDKAILNSIDTDELVVGKDFKDCVK